jgi:PAS domain S-box-containing protein
MKLYFLKSSMKLFMNSKKIKILAIDDNNDNLTSLKALIKEAFPAVIIYTALTGAKGIEIAGAEDPDVILLDIIMPLMDGFDVCKKIKANKKLCDIPVVFITALKDDKQNRIQALECGAEAFLSKPIDQTELTAQIRAMVKIKSANLEKRHENERLKNLVDERTKKLEKELEVRKKAQQEMLSSKKQYDRLVAKIPVGIYILHSMADDSFAFDYVSPRMAEMFKKDVATMLSDVQTVFNSIHPDDLDGFVKLNLEGIVKNRPFDWKGRILIEGTIKWMHFVSSPEKQASGDVLWHGLVVDITQQKNAEKALLEKTELFNLFMKYSPIYAFIKDVSATESRVIKASENYIDMIGIPGAEMEGKTMEELFPPEYAAKFAADDWAVVSGGNMIKLDENMNGRNYTTLKFPIFQGDKNLLAGYTIDITERKQAEGVIKEKVMELERFNNLMVGRELKMIELKQEINDLLLRLGEKEKYVIVK